MTKKEIGTNVFTFPMPVTLLGTLIGGKPNFMALGWISRVNANPPLIGIGVGKHHYSIRGLEDAGVFSINYPTTAMIRETDYCGLVSGKNTEKAELFTVTPGPVTTAPLIDECPLSLECRVVNRFEFGTNIFYIGEIAGAYADEKVLIDNVPDISRMDLCVLTMPDNRYWKIGDVAGKAWSDGRALMKENG